MATYGLEKQAYADDVRMMPEEPPLVQRLEDIRRVLLTTMDTLLELQHGPSPEKDHPGLPMTEGVLNLGAECEKLANMVSNEAMIVAKRIGRL